MSATVPLKIWHPFTQDQVDPPPVRITRAEGAYLYTEDGRRIIDAISSWWVNLHGHSHPHIARAIAHQAENPRSRPAGRVFSSSCGATYAEAAAHRPIWAGPRFLL